MRAPTIRRWLGLSVLLSALGCLCVGSLAQRPGPPGAPGGGQGRRQGFGRPMSVAALPVSTLDSIVKLTPAQKAKVTQIQERLRKESEALRPQPGQPFDPARMQRMRDLSASASREIEALLNPAQKTRLETARQEMRLYRMAGIPLGLYGKIALTADQRTRLQAIQRSLSNGAPGGAGDRQGMREAMRAARERAAAVLTAAQKAQIEKYLQDHPEERRGRRGRGGGPGGPGA